MKAVNNRSLWFVHETGAYLTNQNLFLERNMRLSWWYYPEAHSEPSQTSKMEFIAKIVNNWKP